MKKLFFLFTFLSVVISYAQIVNIPDANFKAKLLQSSPENQIAYSFDFGYIKIDANDDGEIQESEAGLVSQLDISNSSISNLTGINSFVNLFSLNVENNQLTSLSIANNIELISLNASHNLLNSLNVNFNQSQPTDTEGSLNLSYNHFTTLTLEDAYFVNEIDLRNNQLTELSINNIQAGSLSASNNNLTSVHFQSSFFNFLGISSNNGIDSSIVTGNVIVDILNLGNNAIDFIPDGVHANNVHYSSNNTSVDFGNFKTIYDCEPHEMGEIHIVNCPNLQIVILKNGFSHTQITCQDGDTFTQVPTLNLSISNCPNLSFICVDEAEQPFIQARINQLGLENQVQVNNYCSFVPGGEYFTIQGTIRFDADNNGCGIDDIAFPNLKFSISDGTNSGTIIANNTGNYSIPVQEGTHIITPVFENLNYFNVSPSSSTVTFPTIANPFTQDFCITANGVHNDLEVKIVPISIARPGFDSTYKIIYTNKGNQVANGSLNLNYNDLVLDLINTTPINTGFSSNNLSWDFTNLNPFETREIDLTFNINSPMEIPAVNNGDVLVYTASISIDEANDEIPIDNIFTLNQTVVNSFDPNDKTCLEGATIAPDMVGEFVHYIIRFENTGTAPAENIVVADIIDTTKFELASLVPLRCSHDFFTRMNNTTGKVEFIFENINLPFDDANNDGYVSFKIKTKPTLVVGNTFNNTANIYFDYNFPIITNTATTTVTLLGKPDVDFGHYFSMYPNPTKDVLAISNLQDITISSLSIYNSLGQLMQLVTSPKETIDVSNLKTGSYYIKLITEKGIALQKFIKE
ncbi:hypothetical protein GCM10011508_15190 [Flavobacterium lutivivi]|nr:hypothetical protein GCM10011508_15190 [Flavobacterium lutivivi]